MSRQFHKRTLLYVLCSLQLDFHTALRPETIGDALAQPLEADTSLHVVSITDRPKDERVSVLKQSLRSGGYGSPTLHYTAEGEFSWTKRLEIMQQVVQDAAETKPNAVYLFLDAFDTLTFGSPEEVLGKFHKTGKDALFSCVTYPYPQRCEGFDWLQDGSCKDSNWGAQCQHWCRFACAGALVGKAGALARIFAENPVHDTKDDQCYFNRIFAKKGYNIALDHNHEIFFSTTDLMKCSLERKGGRVEVTRTKTLPAAIHFDTTHPSAAHLFKFFQDVVMGTDGPICQSNASCTDWCWDWDIGDMPGRLTNSDRQIFGELGWVLPEQKTVLVRTGIWVASVVLVVGTTLLLGHRSGKFGQLIADTNSKTLEVLKSIPQPLSESDQDAIQEAVKPVLDGGSSSSSCAEPCADN